MTLGSPPSPLVRPVWCENALPFWECRHQPGPYACSLAFLFVCFALFSVSVPNLLQFGAKEIPQLLFPIWGRIASHSSFLNFGLLPPTACCVHISINCLLAHTRLQIFVQFPRQPHSAKYLSASTWSLVPTSQNIQARKYANAKVTQREFIRGDSHWRQGERLG